MGSSWDAQLPFVLSATLLILNMILSIFALSSQQHHTSWLFNYSCSSFFIRFYWPPVWGEYQQLWSWSLPPWGVSRWNWFIHMYMQSWLYGCHMQRADRWMPQQSLPPSRALHWFGEWLPMQLLAGHFRYVKHKWKYWILTEFSHLIISYVCSGVC